MNASINKLWWSTTKNAIWIFYAVNMLFSVSDIMLLYLTILTGVGMAMYYINAFSTLDAVASDTQVRDSWGLFARKVWDITQANGLWLACGISAIFYLEGRLFIYSSIMTTLGFGLFYVYAYKTSTYTPLQREHVPPFSWGTFAKRLWRITEANILSIASTISLLLYVSGYALIQTAIFVSIGLILFYMHAYRSALIGATAASAPMTTAPMRNIASKGANKTPTHKA